MVKPKATKTIKLEEAVKYEERLSSQIEDLNKAHSGVVLLTHKATVDVCSAVQ